MRVPFEIHNVLLCPTDKRKVETIHYFACTCRNRGICSSHVHHDLLLFAYVTRKNEGVNHPGFPSPLVLSRFTSRGVSTDVASYWMEELRFKYTIDIIERVFSSRQLVSFETGVFSFLSFEIWMVSRYESFREDAFINANEIFGTVLGTEIVLCLLWGNFQRTTQVVENIGRLCQRWFLQTF